MLILHLLRCGSLNRIIRPLVPRRNSLCSLRPMTLRSPQCILCSHYPATLTKPLTSCGTIMATSGTWRQMMSGYREQIVGKPALYMSSSSLFSPNDPACLLRLSTFFRALTHVFVLIDNCSFFSARDANIGVILTREPLGNFKAVVIRAEKGGQRDALLSSESAETIQKAYELLLVKSADAVQNYITANGFELPPCSKRIGNVADDDDDDGVSSVSSASEVMDGDLDKDLEDSTLSFEAESAYESMTESEACAGGYDRARGTHTSRNSRMCPKWVRRSSRSPRRDDRDFLHEVQPRGPHHAPQHSFPVQRRRSSPIETLNPKAGGLIARHVPPGSAAPPAAQGMLPPGAWRAGPGAPMPSMPPPPPMTGNLGHAVYSDHVPMGGLRPHPSQMFPTQAPPLPQTGRMVPPPPPPPNTLPQQAQAKHTANKVNLNGNNYAGPSPTSSPPVSNSHNTHPVNKRAPPPSAPSQSSLTSSPPTHAAGPNKPPSASPPQPAPAPLTPLPAAQFPGAIDYRLCIKSRVPGTGDTSEQRIVVRTPPTRAHVRAAAMRYVEYNPSLFKHLLGAPPLFKADGGGAAAPPASAVADRHLRANVTRVVFGTTTSGAGSESYDLTTYGEDDLSRLCASVAGGRAGGASELPLFEVVVTNVGPAGSFFTLA